MRRNYSVLIDRLLLFDRTGLLTTEDVVSTAPVGKTGMMNVRSQHLLIDKTGRSERHREGRLCVSTNLETTLLEPLLAIFLKSYKEGDHARYKVPADL